MHDSRSGCADVATTHCLPRVGCHALSHASPYKNAALRITIVCVPHPLDHRFYRRPDVCFCCNFPCASDDPRQFGSSVAQLTPFAFGTVRKWLPARAICSLWPWHHDGSARQVFAARSSASSEWLCVCKQTRRDSSCSEQYSGMRDMGVDRTSKGLGCVHERQNTMRRGGDRRQDG